MFGNEMVKNTAYIPIPSQDWNDAAVASCYIDMSQYGHATVYITTGDTVGATAAVTLDQATDSSGTGSQTLSFTRMFSTGQKLVMNTVVGTFAVGETVEGGSSALTGEIFEVGATFLRIRCLTGGTTWTTTETLTGATSGATAVLDGTGQDEDILLASYTAPSSTFTIPAVTFKTYALEVEADSLDVADGYRYMQVDIADPGGATIAGGCIILSKPRNRSYPMASALGTQKIVATVT